MFCRLRGQRIVKYLKRLLSSTNERRRASPYTALSFVAQANETEVRDPRTSRVIAWYHEPLTFVGHPAHHYYAAYGNWNVDILEVVDAIK